MTFGCGHPRWPENVTAGGNCRFCARVAKIIEKVERGQERINAGLPVDGRVGMAAEWL